MGFYNVVKPCVVGKLHYARPTVQPIVVDDEAAAPLVESGCLEPYGHHEHVHVQDAVSPYEGLSDVFFPEEDAPVEPKPRRSRRRTGESDGEAD